MPGQNGQSPSEPDSAGNGSTDPRGLTVGQRLLLKLPDLGRRKQSAGDDSAPEPVKKSAPKPAAYKPTTPGNSATTPKPRRADRDDIEHVDDVEVLDDVRPEHAEDESAVDSDRPSRPSSSRPSSSRSQRPSSTAAYDKMPTSELTVLMRKLDDKERMLAFGASPLGGVLAIVLTFITLSHNPALHHTGHESSGIIIADGGVGVVFALFVLAMAWFRRRSLTAFALLFLGYSLGLVGIGIPFLFLGGYLLFRAWRIQKVLTSRGVSTRPQRRAPARSPRDPKRRRDAPAKPTSARPTASKRYTPPKPPPKRPPVAKPEKAAGP